MRAQIFDEPELEFGSGARHVDPRFGISDYGPADLNIETAPRRIRVGLVGPADGTAGVRRWLEACRSPIDAKHPNRYPALFRDFPGFNPDQAFLSELVFDDSLTHDLSRRQLTKAMSKPGALAVAECVDAYAAAVERLVDTGRCDVVVCARPEDLEDRTEPEDDSEQAASVQVDKRRIDFHDLLKAQCLSLKTPIQIVRPITWSGRSPKQSSRSDKKRRRERRAPLQDEATRAWNIHTALYYKAGGVPWRLPRSSTELASLFVGVSFFHTPERDAVHTSVAYVFNERGEGVVVRGGPAAQRKEDRQPHLPEDGARDLLESALMTYKNEHHTLPARLVMHKTSDFDDAEVRGFTDAADSHGVSHLELLWIQCNDPVRLFRGGEHAVLRGTFVELAEDRHVLFTRGSIDFYGVYPGMYIPNPIGLRLAMNDHDAVYLAHEILSLSKMNWNQSQLDGRLPITLRASKRVAEILKHLPNEPVPVSRYAQFI